MRLGRIRFRGRGAIGCMHGGGLGRCIRNGRGRNNMILGSSRHSGRDAELAFCSTTLRGYPCSRYMYLDLRRKMKLTPNTVITGETGSADNAHTRYPLAQESTSKIGYWHCWFQLVGYILRLTWHETVTNSVKENWIFIPVIIRYP